MTKTSSREVTLSWIAEVDASTLGAEADSASVVLRRLLAEPDSFDGGEVTRAISRVLQACAETDPEVVPTTEALKLLYPVLLHVKNADQWSVHAARLQDLMSRQALISKHPIHGLLGQYRKAMASGTAIGVDPQRASGGARDGDAVIENSSAGSDPVVNWLEHRAALMASHRAAQAVTLLRDLSRGSIPTPFAEAVYQDEELRASTEWHAYVLDLGRPFQASVHGLASAALLNAVVRRVRPRLFLKHPRAIVAEESAAKLDGPAVRRDISKDVAEPIIRCIHLLWEEIERTTARKPQLRSARSAAEQVLQRLGLRFEGQVGESGIFDPIFHVSADALEYGTPVEVSRPGIIDATSGDVVVKAQVDRRSVEENHG